MARAWIGLGANLGEAEAALRSVMDEIRALPCVLSLRASSFYSTSPVDSSGPDYVNAVAEIETEETPEGLLKLLQKLENAHGRVRPAGVHNAPRTMDLDLLAYEGETRRTAFLTLPHPRMNERLFVLVPLAELVPDWTTPAGEAIDEVIARVRCTDPSQAIRRLS